MGHSGATSPTWRLVGTTRSQAPELAAALSGLKTIPAAGQNTPRLKGKKMRRLAALRGSLAFTSRGGAAFALIFCPTPDSGLPKRIQRGEALGARHLLEAAFFGAGWATQWSPRQSPDPEQLAAFYDLQTGEEVLGWLFVGRPLADDAAATSTFPPRPIPLRMR